MKKRNWSVSFDDFSIRTKKFETEKTQKKNTAAINPKTGRFDNIDSAVIISSGRSTALFSSSAAARR